MFECFMDRLYRIAWLSALLIGGSCFGGARVGMAQPSPSHAAVMPRETSTGQNVHLHYNMYVRGYHFVNVDADYVLQPWGYGIQTHLYSVGLASWFFTVNLLSTAQGHFNEVDTRPLSYDNRGFSRGEELHTHIEFDHTGPHVTVLQPPETGREAMPEVEFRQSVDMLSYLVGLVHHMDVRQNCTTGQSVFDGIRLSYMDMHGPFKTTLPTDHHPFYTGDAMRCDFTGKQIGGFSIGSPFKDAKATPHPGSVWFVRDPKAGLIPVRLQFSHPKIGMLLVVLQTPPYLSAVPAQAAPK
ncbi:DUF3108 domain-containing protein [Bombella saccharophila]|uniref:DUF3108 domain-containing protein n=1 Tax=Bombella saccharophila TaxID=2967338 RepID=A0ABT3W530_9PROT|nr:DUF3108 domain-containing protein [Bombella saccharophila]MCX5614166.1 DUF3108 domain-containing protein [Bombella saccharophila]PHI95216.1 hypothetical protein BG621_07205 [Parasaccharibacter apium]